MRIDKVRLRLALPYVLMAATSLCVAFFVLRLWDADIRILFRYEAGSDATFTAAFVKAIIDHGWFFHNPSLGAPAGADWYDFPQPSFWHFVVLKLIGFFARDVGLTINVYYLASYALIALAALYSLRRARIVTPIAFACALLFAFIPDHMLRSEAHLFYALFYSVPLMALALLSVARGDALWERRGGRFARLTRAGWFALAATLLTAWDNQYHAAFTLVFLAVAAVIGAVRTRTLRPLATGGALAGVIAVAVMVEVLPTLGYDIRHGKNTAVGHRIMVESELYALKLTHLVLPVAQHRIPALADAKHAYSVDTGSDDLTASFPTLGLLGTAGFFGLFLLLLLPWKPPHYARELHDLAGLNLTAFLLGTVGGIGALIALFVSPEIRAYGRISPYISWFSLFALAIFAQLAIEKCPPRQRRFVAYWAAAAIAVIGLFDQTSPAFNTDYAGAGALRNSDAAVVAHVEAAVPPGARIYELPYVPFPESAPVNALPAYAELRPYLFSHSVRWSFGALMSTSGDAFERSIAALAPDRIADVLAHDGFAGVMIFRAGYADRGGAVEAALRAATGAAPIVSDAGDLAFFALPPPANALDDDALERRIETVVYARFETGFYPEESNAHERWHWATNAAKLILENGTRKTRHITATFKLRTGSRAAVEIRGAAVAARFIATPGGQPVTLRLELQPGVNQLDFSSDAPPIPNTDARRLVFSVIDLALDGSSDRVPTRGR